MAMVQARCVDGPKAGEVVWVADDSDGWSTATMLRGRLHYSVAGRSDDGSLIELRFVKRSR